MSTKPKFKGYRLVRQVEQSNFEYREYGAPKIRHKTYYDINELMFEYEKPDRSDYYNRSWKHYRKTQYKDKK